MPRSTMRRSWLLALLILMGVGCAPLVPATVPAQLSATPGPPVQISDRTYNGVLFRAMYPGGWRVITSAADAPQTVIFVAPDDRALIVVSVTPLDNPPQPQIDDPLRDRSDTVSLGALSLYVYGVAPAEDWPAFLARYDRVLDSLMQS